jgi:methylenetetrahydrofolate reductase (NADPH)
LALRGDKPREELPPEAGSPGFSYAVDLIKYIRERFGDYFDIGVAGYPDGHPEALDVETDIRYLKAKLDAGATFIITQMFYDVDLFLDWVRKCRKFGITCPIIPGIMPITSWTTLLRRTRLMHTRIPDYILNALEPIKDDDAAVREVGTNLIADLCRKILEHGILQLHFYTMNLEKATFMILEKMEITTAMNLKNPLPWRQVRDYRTRKLISVPRLWTQTRECAAHFLEKSQQELCGAHSRLGRISERTLGRFAIPCLRRA